MRMRSTVGGKVDWERRAYMEIKVLYFQSAMKAAGCREETLAIGEDSTVADLITRLTQSHPALEALAASLLYAVNETHGATDRQLSDGDVVALMPPFSGG